MRLDFYRDQKLYLSFTLDGEQTEIGRAAECDVQLLEERVSRVHAVVMRDGAGHRLIDRSVNGTRVNHSVISGETTLQPGDRIYIADYVAVYRSDGAASSGLSADPTVIEL